MLRDPVKRAAVDRARIRTNGSAAWVAAAEAQSRSAGNPPATGRHDGGGEQSRRSAEPSGRAPTSTGSGNRPFGSMSDPGPGAPAPAVSPGTEPWTARRVPIGGFATGVASHPRGEGAAGPPPGNPSGSVLNFGRYRGMVAGRGRPVRRRVPRVARSGAHRADVPGGDRRDPARPRPPRHHRRPPAPPPRPVPQTLSTRRQLAPRHHSARCWRMLMLWITPSPSAMLTSDAPPWVMNGSGIPVTGRIPTTMPDVDEDLEQQHRGDARPEQRPERIARPPRRHDHPPQQCGEQQEHDDRADEPELLGQDGEHEVALLDRQELAARLRAVGEARPEQAPRAHGDLRLEHLPAGALGVGGGVEEREDPRPLVVVEDVVPGDRDRDAGRRRPRRSARAGSRRT